jgi:hypothetical protein
MSTWQNNPYLGLNTNLVVKPYLNNKVNPESFRDSIRLYKNSFIETKQPTLISDIINDNISNDPNANDYYEAGINNILPGVRKSYVRVDSRQRSLYPENIYGDDIYYLDPYPLVFENGSSKVTIMINNNSFDFKQNERITLKNVVSKSVILRNPLSVKKNSFYIQIFQRNHGLSLFGLYDPLNSDDFLPVNEVAPLPTTYKPDQIIPDGLIQYYILKINLTLDFFIQLANVSSNNNNGFIGNIPINFLNKRHRVFLLFVKQGITFVQDPNVYLIHLEKKSSINYSQSQSQFQLNDNNFVSITFLMLYGIPINYLNADLPITEINKYPYFTIESATSSSIVIDVGYNAIVDPITSFYSLEDNSNNISDLIGTSRGGGQQCFIQHIIRILNGYPNPNTYNFVLDRTYRAVTQVNLISSEFPNSQVIITNYPEDQANNRLYWQNLDDGDHIYFIETTPGNYSTHNLIKELEYQFGKTIRYPYINSVEDNSLYDCNGNYKYNIIKVNIDESTSIVSFESFGKVLLQDTLCCKIIYIPDNIMVLTQHENLTIANVSREFYSPLVLSSETLFVYFTPCTVKTKYQYPYANYNLYQLTQIIYSNRKTRTDDYRVILENNISILVNFYKTTPTPHQEINSINTKTLLENFNYNYVENQVILPDHNLKIGDIILSDQLNDLISPNILYVYEIIEIVNDNIFNVKRYDIGKKYKFVYDDLLINFKNILNASPNYVLMETYNQTINHVIISSEKKNIVKVHQPNHSLNTGDKIYIEDSSSINQVPANIINSCHNIHRIIDNDNYEFIIGSYTPILSLTNLCAPLNIVTIRYPLFFRMYFNYTDTLGNLLSFNKVGQDIAITAFLTTIYNYQPYEIDYNYDTLGNDYIQRLKKLFMTGENYFYIVCPKIGFYSNTMPVENVYATIRWSENPGAVVFDTFVPIVYTYEKPISILTELTFSFNLQSGSLVNFNGLDHSFTLEIVEVFNISPETNIDARLDAQVIQTVN